MSRHSLTTWNRLEPRTRNAELTDGLRATIQDPLWLLGRQWQVGEFRGTDGGSPVNADIEATVDAITRYRPGDPTDDTDEPSRSATDADGSPLPLEVLVEREPVRPVTDGPPNYKLATEAGQQFLRLLAAAEFSPGDAFENFRISVSEDDLVDVDPQTRRYVLVAAGRALDGNALFEAFERAEVGESELPRPPNVQPDTSADQQYRTAVVDPFRSWYLNLYAEPDGERSAWDPTRLEYRFAISTGPRSDETVFEAREYTTGHLDWYSFDVLDGVTLEPDAEGSEEDTARETRKSRTIPTAIEFPGMPRDRWWEFEERDVNLPDLEVAQEDLSRLLLLEFGLVYGNDWFSLPIELPVGSLARLTRFEITDTFGERIRSRGPVATADNEMEWNLYAVPLPATGDRPTRGLFLAPVLGDSLEGRAVESVAFTRDEVANIAWAIEQQVEGPTGASLDRVEEAQGTEMNTEPTEQPGDDSVPYRLMTRVPDYWFPLLPRQVDTSPDIERAEIEFVRGQFAFVEHEDAIEPRGRIVAELNDPIPEEEIPRGGTTVSRAYQLTRWIDGSTFLWSGRNVTPGGSNRSSGLAFDILEDGRSSISSVGSADR